MPLCSVSNDGAERALTEADEGVPGAVRAGWLQRVNRRVWWIAFAILVVLLTSMLLLWSQRVPIAENFIDSELATRKVRATYSVTQIGPHTQRIENLVLGDPARPDMVAKLIEVDIGYDYLFPRVTQIRAEGVRFYGRIEKGTLTLGELDKFMAGERKEPFRLPDLGLSLVDARARIETPAGPIGMVMEGKGNLSDGFAGKIAALVRNPRISGCASPKITAYLDISVSAGVPRLAGPVRSGALGCPEQGITIAGLGARIDMRSDPDFTRLGGQVIARAQGLRAAGVLIDSPGIEADVDGNAQSVGGTYLFSAKSLASSFLRSAALRVDGAARWNKARQGSGFAVGGQLDARNAVLYDGNSLAGLKAGTQDTPVGPLVQQLVQALEKASGNSKLAVTFDANESAGKGRLTVSRAYWKAASGAQVRLGKDSYFRFDWPGNAWVLNGGATSEGGGLPRAALRLQSTPSGGVGGQLFLDPYRAGSARLSAEPVRFIAQKNGTTLINTQVTLDGPLNGGSISGLTLPLRASVGPAGMRLNPDCTFVRLAKVRFDSVSASRLGMTLCPLDRMGLLSIGKGGVRGGAQIHSLRLVGQLGGTAAELTADHAQLTLADGRLVLDKPQLLLGQGDSLVRLAATRLDGRGQKGGIGGYAQGVEARIGTVPLLVQEGAANWNFAGDALRLFGSIGVIDAAVPDRFNPLVSHDFMLTMADGEITAGGGLVLPKGSAEIARLAIRHDLGSGKGVADLKVDGLRFNPTLQPEDITRLALGVVANVNGVVNGAGQIRWSPDGVSSDGSFETSNADLAAAFGPVSGLSGRIHFTDLIGMVSSPGQKVTIKSVNPGVEARDGTIIYALLPGQRVAVESGRWPFAGGDLSLLPTILDFSADKPRNLTFRVLGLEAGAFIQTLELDNISATGTFDGLLPMVFDSNGGRIVGGILVARQSGGAPLVIDRVEGLNVSCDQQRLGGTLSYVGQVSNEQLGKMGKLAFDALKDLQYKCLTILMDGNIDGELVTQVVFNGVNRGELSSVPKTVSKQFVGLPFIFNIRVAAPFRGLLNTAKSFADPGLLIHSHMNDSYKSTIENRLAVQPRESETEAKGGSK